MWYLTLHRYIKPREEARAVLEDHLQWVFNEHQAGRLLFSGPTTDKTIGIIVLRADSIDEAKANLETEPFIQHGYRNYEIYEWDIHQAMGVGAFSQKSVLVLKEDYDRLNGA